MVNGKRDSVNSAGVHEHARSAAQNCVVESVSVGRKSHEDQSDQSAQK
jgi:hypothetical protein